MVMTRMSRDQKLGTGGALGAGGLATGAVLMFKDQGQAPVQGPQRMPQTPPYPEQPYYPPPQSNPDRYWSPGYSTLGSGGDMGGSPVSGDTYGGGVPADTYYAAAPVYAPASAGYAPAASMPVAPVPPPPPMPSNWSMKLGERLAAFNPVAGSRTLALPNNLPGPRPQFRQAGTPPPPMPLPNLPAYRKPQGM